MNSENVVVNTQSSSDDTYNVSISEPQPHPDYSLTLLGSTDKKLEDHGKRIEGLEKLEKKASSILQEAKNALNVSEKINMITATVLVVAVIAFVIAIYGIWLDYSHNLYDERKYFLEFLKDYQTKDNAREDINMFKACIRNYGLKSCLN